MPALQKPKQKLAFFHLQQECAAVATFLTTIIMQCLFHLKKKPCIRILLVLTQPRPQDWQCSCCARCFCALLPSCLATTICSLAQPSAPVKGRPRLLIPSHHKQRRREEVCVCSCVCVYVCVDQLFYHTLLAKSS